MDIPDQLKELIDARLEEYYNNPTNVLNWDEVVKEFDKEDEAAQDQP
jgi:hypothetical protein